MDLLRALRGKKDDQQSAVDQAKERASLLKNISRAIKEVQVHHATLSPGQTVKDCRATLQLCTSFESALRHGLKSNLFGQASTFWPVALKISRKQAVEYINTLQFAQSDNGRSRAWIRLAVNESSLESYISVLLHDVTLLSKYYEPYSFLRDEELTGPLQQLLAGLSQVSFNIGVDTASLEFEMGPSVVQPVVTYPAMPVVSSQDQGGGGGDTMTHQPSVSNKQLGTEGQERRQPLYLPDGIVSSSSGDGGSGGGSGSGGGAGGGDAGGGDELKKPPSSYKGQQFTPEDHEPSLQENQQPPYPPEGLDRGGEPPKLPSPSGLAPECVPPLPEKQLPPSSEQRPYSLEDVGSLSLDSASGDGSNSEEAAYGSGSRRASNGTGVAMQGANGTDSSRSTGSPAVGLITMESIDCGSPEPWNQERMLLKCESTGSDVFSFSPMDKPSPKTDLLERGEVVLTGAMPTQKELPGQRGVEVESLPLLVVEARSLPIQGGVESLPTHLGAESPPTQVVVETRSSPKPNVPSEASNPPSPKPNVPSEASNPPAIQSSAGSKREEMVHPPLSSAGSGHTYTDGKTTHLDDQTWCAGGEQVTTVKETVPMDTRGAPLGGIPVWPDDEAVVKSQTELQVKDLSPCPSDLEPVFRSRSNCILSADTEGVDHTKQTGELCESPAHTQAVATTTARTKHEQEIQGAPTSTTKENPSMDLSESTVLIGSYSPPPGPSSLAGSLLPGASGSSVDVREDSVGCDEDTRDLCIDSDHFSQELDIVKLEEMIQNLKQDIRRDDSTVKKDRLINYQIRLQQLKDGGAVNAILGHTLCCQATGQVLAKGYTCDGCTKTIHGVRRAWYRCSSCCLCVHEGCLKLLSRQCSSVVKETEYTLELCPEKGLTHQHFRCAQCNKHLDPLATDMKICDYSGLWYCSECHHGDLAFIPARVVHNWDFKQYKVCCRCAIVLGLMYHKPLLSIKALNDKLYSYVEDLTTVETLREGMGLMKKYIVQCRLAKEEGLCEKFDALLPANVGTEFYSLCDLVELQSGLLVKQLQESHTSFSRHIKECPICSGKGYYCLYCKTDELLFPFDRNVECCANCKTVSHRLCGSRSRECPNCIRLKLIAQRVK